MATFEEIQKIQDTLYGDLEEENELLQKERRRLIQENNEKDTESTALRKDVQKLLKQVEELNKLIEVQDQAKQKRKDAEEETRKRKESEKPRVALSSSSAQTDDVLIKKIVEHKDEATATTRLELIASRTQTESHLSGWQTESKRTESTESVERIDSDSSGHKKSSPLKVPKSTSKPTEPSLPGGRGEGAANKSKGALPPETGAPIPVLVRGVKGLQPSPAKKAARPSVQSPVKLIAAKPVEEDDDDDCVIEEEVPRKNPVRETPSKSTIGGLQPKTEISSPTSTRRTSSLTTSILKSNGTPASSPAKPTVSIRKEASPATSTEKATSQPTAAKASAATPKGSKETVKLIATKGKETPKSRVTSRKSTTPRIPLNLISAVPTKRKMADERKDSGSSKKRTTEPLASTSVTARSPPPPASPVSPPSSPLTCSSSSPQKGNTSKYGIFDSEDEDDVPCMVLPSIMSFLNKH